MSLKSWKERRKRMGLKKYLKKQWLKLSKFGKKPKPTDSRSLMNPKQNKSKKYMTRQIIIKLLKTKRKSIESIQEKNDTLPIKGK